MLTDDEFLRKIESNESICCEDLDIPSWHKDCDNFLIEVDSFLYGSGTIYKHKDGYRWANGTFLTKRQCKHYKIEPGRLNCK